MTMIEKIKQSNRLEPLAAQLCGGLKPSGHSKRYLIGWCPFCQPEGKKPGKHARFWVDTEMQICNCFKPTCKADKPMDVINLYARWRHLDNDSAIADLYLETLIGGKA